LGELSTIDELFGSETLAFVAQSPGRFSGSLRFQGLPERGVQKQIRARVSLCGKTFSHLPPTRESLNPEKRAVRGKGGFFFY